MGQNGDATIDIDQMARRFTGPVAQSLREVGFNSVFQLLSTYAGRAEDLKPWLTNAYVNTDLDLRLQYMAGMGLNYNNAPAIRQQIGTYGRFPEGMFKGTPAEIEQIQGAFR
jgi:spermidine synthase